MRRALSLLTFPVLALAACSSSSDEPPPRCDPHFPPTGYFRVAEACEGWTLVDPDGARFYSRGVNQISWDADEDVKTKRRPYKEAVTARYGTKEVWAKATADRLASWGFNTAGAWSDVDALAPHMPYTVILDIAQANWGKNELPDYWAPSWSEGAERIAETKVTPRAKDRNLLGWFLDNEMHWGPDGRVGAEIFDGYLAFAATAPGKKALVEHLRTRHGGDIARFNTAWGKTFASFDALLAPTTLPYKDLSPEARGDRDTFLEAVADRFFSVTTTAIRKRDPNHMILGVRFVSVYTPRVVVQAAGRYLDVISVNAYEFGGDLQILFDPERLGTIRLDTPSWLSGFSEVAHKPLLIGEFGFRAEDSGLPNGWPPIYPTLATQTERADRFQEYAERAFKARYVVGWHWYQYMDQPAGGRFDGENNNWGLVNIADDPYEPLVSRAKGLASP